MTPNASLSPRLDEWERGAAPHQYYPWGVVTGCGLHKDAKSRAGGDRYQGREQMWERTAWCIPHLTGAGATCRIHATWRLFDQHMCPVCKRYIVSLAGQVANFGKPLTREVGTAWARHGHFTQEQPLQMQVTSIPWTAAARLCWLCCPGVWPSTYPFDQLFPPPSYQEVP